MLQKRILVNKDTETGVKYYEAYYDCPDCSGKGQLINSAMKGLVSNLCPYCQGLGYIVKEEKELPKNKKKETEENITDIKPKRRRRKADPLAEYKQKEILANKQKKWLLDNSFAEDGTTYIVLDIPYGGGDDLKKLGGYYSRYIGWHIAQNVQGYNTHQISIYDVADVNEYYGFRYNYEKCESMKKYLLQFSKAKQERDKIYSVSKYVGAEGDKLNLKCKLYNRSGYESAYGYTSIYIFIDEVNNLYVWYSQKNLEIAVGQIIELEGTVKAHKEYKGVKQTVLTRCKITI